MFASQCTAVVAGTESAWVNVGKFASANGHARVVPHKAQRRLALKHSLNGATLGREKQNPAE